MAEDLYDYANEYSNGPTVKKVSCSKCIDMIFTVFFNNRWKKSKKTIWEALSKENGPNIKMNLLMTFSWSDRSKRLVTNTANNRFIRRIDYWTFKIWLITDKDLHMISDSFMTPVVHHKDWKSVIHVLSRGPSAADVLSYGHIESTNTLVKPKKFKAWTSGKRILVLWKTRNNFKSFPYTSSSWSCVAAEETSFWQNLRMAAI